MEYLVGKINTSEHDIYFSKTVHIELDWENSSHEDMLYE